MKLKHISAKFILTFVGILVAAFSILVTALEVSFKKSMNNHIKRNSFSMQSELDAGVTDVVNESAYLYARIMQSTNIELLNAVSDIGKSNEERAIAFNALIAHAGMSEDQFAGVTLLLDGLSFSVGTNVVLSEEKLAKISASKNVLQYVENYDGNILMGINAYEQSSDFDGIFLFNIAQRKVQETCNPASIEEGYSFIMRSDGYIVSHTDDQLVGRIIVYSDIYNPAAAPEYKQVKLNGKQCIVVTSTASMLNSRYGFDSCIISVLDYNHYFGYADTMLTIVTALSAVVLVAVVAIAIFLAHRISKPITLLSARINSTNEPTKEHASVLEEGDEITQLERNYDKMMDRIYDLMEKNKEDMQLQRQLELESLQMSINPHFLYNTLDAISWMAKMKNQPDIDKLVMNLAKFFRLFLHNGDMFVTVHDEVEIVVCYLEIDKIRKPGRVEFVTEIAEDVQSLHVLRLILQPIIENSLKHGFAAKGGNIVVRAYKNDGDIIIEVEDDGAGFDVPDDILTHKSQKEGGYGLKNVHERLHLQFGEGYGLSIKSQKGKGTVVTVKSKIID